VETSSGHQDDGNTKCSMHGLGILLCGASLGALLP